MKRSSPALALAASVLLCAATCLAADAPAPVVKSAGEIDFHASGSLPPGAEYHLIYEEPTTHAVQTLVKMPRGYALPVHRHSYDETIFVIKGKIVLGFAAGERTVAAGGYAVVPAETPFSMKIEGFGGAEFVAAFNGPFDAKPAAPAKP
jgi:quercetin dioxygenase-like cupin family protein